MQKDEKKQAVTIVIGDSLGAPRPWVGVTLKNTYAYKLSKLLGPNYFVANYSVSENSTKKIVKESFLRTYIRDADISYAIIQVGIVDCAPRLLSNFERLLAGISSRVKILSFVFNKYIAIKSKHRVWLTKNFPRTLVPLQNFELNYRRLLTELIRTNPIQKVFLLEIAYPGDYLLEKSFNILGNINSYNNAIHLIASENPSLIEVIGLFEQTKSRPDWITPEDGHHILPGAHEWIAQQLLDRIKLP